MAERKFNVTMRANIGPYLPGMRIERHKRSFGFLQRFVPLPLWITVRSRVDDGEWRTARRFYWIFRGRRWRWL